MEKREVLIDFANFLIKNRLVAYTNGTVMYWVNEYLKSINTEIKIQEKKKCYAFVRSENDCPEIPNEKCCCQCGQWHT